MLIYDQNLCFAFEASHFSFAAERKVTKRNAPRLGVATRLPSLRDSFGSRSQGASCPSSLNRASRAIATEKTLSVQLDARGDFLITTSTCNHKKKNGAQTSPCDELSRRCFAPRKLRWMRNLGCRDRSPFTPDRIKIPEAQVVAKQPRYQGCPSLVPFLGTQERDSPSSETTIGKTTRGLFSD